MQPPVGYCTSALNDLTGSIRKVRFFIFHRSRYLEEETQQSSNKKEEGKGHKFTKFLINETGDFHSLLICSSSFIKYSLNCLAYHLKVSNSRFYKILHEHITTVDSVANLHTA